MHLSQCIQKVHVTDGGGGYTDLPNVTITTTTGTSASLLAVTDDIGAIDLECKDGGFNYSASNPPDLTARAHFVLKDVTGLLQHKHTHTHVGTVKSFDSNTNILETTFENVSTSRTRTRWITFNQGIELEDGNVAGDATIVEGIQLEDEQEVETQEDDNIILDGTEVVTPDARFIRHTVKVIRNATDTATYIK